MLNWLKRAGFVIFGLLAAMVLLVAALLIVLDETHYQRVLVWSADHFLDSELLIPGTLSVAYSEGVVLSTQAFQLAAHDG
ncbi:MAG: hypothetical protein WBN57_02400, partial [Gammaproteobacteria bacterium]